MKVVIISAGLEVDRWRMQPNRTLLEMGRQLRLHGHEVALLSDGRTGLASEDQLLEMRVRRVSTVRWLRTRHNEELADTIAAQKPDLLFWHLGLTGFLHQEFHHEFASATVAVVTSPIHEPNRILRLGLTNVLSNVDLAAVHLAGALVPGSMVQHAFGKGGIHGLITLSETTRQYLVRKGASWARSWVVPPGVDREWFEHGVNGEGRRALRQSLAFTDEEFVVVYFGSPAPVRGLHTLVRALKRARENCANLRLLILSRYHPYWARQVKLLQQLIKRNALQESIILVDAFLSREELIAYITAGDAVCLPFELVPSDVPLTVLEAMALQQPVITTTISSLPELAGEGRGFLVPPGSVVALAKQLEEVAGNPELAAATAKCGYKYVETSRTWRAMGVTLERVLGEVDGR